MSDPATSGTTANQAAVQQGVVVAGHICLDIIPAFTTSPDPVPDPVPTPAESTAGDVSGHVARHVVVPGALTNVGPAALSTGGAVSNTGLALHRLGIPTRLMGKVGDDLFGRAIVDLVRRRDLELAAGMIVASDSPSSYTIVLSPPGVDRSFLHCPGANDTFGVDDVDTARLAGAQIFHFGYPPLMRRMYSGGGQELGEMLRRVKAAGLAVSLDMAHVDVDSPAGRIDWRQLLAYALPNVDFFLPSLDEIFFMLNRTRYEACMAQARGSNPATCIDAHLLGDLADQAIDLGAAIVVIKLADQGIYLRTTNDRARLAAVGARSLDADHWLDRELMASAFQVQVIGTTGAGDCAIAGFLAAVLRGQPPTEALMAATAAGAFNVEAADAVSGIPTWETLQARVAAGWPQRTNRVARPGWQPVAAFGSVYGLWRSPRDRQPASIIRP